MKRLLLLCLLASAACLDTRDPCPLGSDPGYDFCVRTDDLPLTHDDAGADADVGGKRDDASVGVDAGDDQTLPTEDAGSQDAGADAEVGGGVCSVSDVEAWRAFHELTSTQQVHGVVDRLKGCLPYFLQGDQPGQTPSNKELGLMCVQEQAGVAECGDCLMAEARCAAVMCSSACSHEHGSDTECRACVCEAGCTGIFDSCANETLDVCPLNVFGPAFVKEDHRIARPFAMRIKQSTGMFDRGFIQAPPNEMQSPVLQFGPDGKAWSKFFTHLVGMWLGGKPYLLASKSEIMGQGVLNIARISPVLVDGTLGTPVYYEAWNAGWDEVEFFVSDDQPYLLRYNRTPTHPDKGTLRIDRLEQDAGGKITLVEALAPRSDTRPSLPAWSNIEPFRRLGKTYLLFHNNEDGGALRINRVDLVQGKLQLPQVSSDDIEPLRGGYDVIEAFPYKSQWYVLAYQSQGSDAADEPGRVQLHAFGGSADGRSVSLQHPTYTGTFPLHRKRVVPFYYGNDYYLLLLHPGDSGAAAINSFSMLRMDTTDLSASLGTMSATVDWGSGWTGLEVIGSSPW